MQFGMHFHTFKGTIQFQLTFQYSSVRQMSRTKKKSQIINSDSGMCDIDLLITSKNPLSHKRSHAKEVECLSARLGYRNLVLGTYTGT